MPTHPAMSATQLGHYLRRIRLSCSVPALLALPDEIEQRFPDDEATPRLLVVIAIKVKRLTEAN